MGNIKGLPQGDAATACIPLLPPVLINGCPGRNSTRCFATPIGPTPGPPPPWGIANVL